MRRSGWKDVAGGIWMASLLALGGISVQAQNEGSVVLQMPQEAVGAEVSLYTVADYTDSEGYVFQDTFAECGIVITDLRDSSQMQGAAERLATYVAEQNVEGKKGQVSERAEVRFEKLTPGLYLSAQTDGFQSVILQPALIPVPYLTEDGGGSVYDIVISPKYSLPGGAVIATKTDESGTVLGQAHFVLQKKTYPADGNVPDDAAAESDEDGVFYWKDFDADLVSNESGQIVLSDLSMGLYRLVETQAPSGCILNTTPHEFLIEEPGTVVEIEGIYQEESGAVAAVQIVNQRTTLRVHKVDREGQPVAGARLVVKDANGQIILDENGNAKYSFVTTDQPYELKGLAAGEYYISELEAPDGYAVAQDVKLTLSDAADTVNEVTMVDERQEETSGRLIVTKELCDLNGDRLMVEDALFYVALFADAERQNRISDVEPLHCQQGSSTSAIFENLEIGRTYYVGETDAFGNFMESGLYEDCLFVPEYPDGHEISLTQGQEGSIGLRNVFHEIPQGYYYEGELTITKKVLKGSAPYGTDQVFYAAVYTDKNYTEQYGDLITLNMDGAETLSVTVPVSLGADPDAEIVYYVAETDRNGNVYDGASRLEFAVSLDKTSVRMSAANASEEVTIINTYPEEVKERESENPVVDQKNNGSAGSSTVRTGDDTPVLEFLCVLGGALVMLLLLVMWKMGRKAKEQ